MIILDIIFEISDKNIIFLEKFKKSGDYIIPIILVLLGISYALITPYPFWATVLGGISLVVICIYLILIAYLYLRHRYLLWKISVRHEK